MSDIILQKMLHDAAKYANFLIADKVICADEVRDMFTDAKNRIEDTPLPALTEKPQTKIGNDCTGDVTKLVEVCDVAEVSGSNWIKGKHGPFKFCAKIFNEQSTYGIKDGRISKLQICDASKEHWGFEHCFVNYDRGWDIMPQTEEAASFLNLMLEALGDDPMTEEDLIYYQIYAYDTVEDFDNRLSSDNFGAFFSMDIAREVAEDECTGYERVKIISSDGEECEIIENEPIEDDE